MQATSWAIALFGLKLSDIECFSEELATRTTGCRESRYLVQPGFMLAHTTLGLELPQNMLKAPRQP